jgi:hypothetical protein
VSTTIKKRAAKWFCQHGHEADQKGCSVCHVVFIFRHNTPIGLMKCTLNNVYRAILTKYDRDPRKSDNAEKPWFFLWPDVPGSAAEQHALNERGDSGADHVDGIHYHAVVMSLESPYEEPARYAATPVPFEHTARPPFAATRSKLGTTGAAIRSIWNSLDAKVREEVNDGHPEKIRNGRQSLDAMVTRSDAR